MPLVATQSGGPSDILPELGFGALIDPYYTASLARGLRDVLMAPERELAARDDMVAAGVEWLGDFPAEDSKMFVEAVSETWKLLAEEAGGRAPEYRERVLESLGR